MWYIYLCNGIPHSHKNDEILSLVTTWMELKDIRLNEISQAKKDKYCSISLMCNQKNWSYRSWEQWSPEARERREWEALANRFQVAIIEVRVFYAQRAIIYSIFQKKRILNVFTTNNKCLKRYIYSPWFELYTMHTYVKTSSATL